MADFRKMNNDGVELLLAQYLVQQRRFASCLGNPEFCVSGNHNG